MTFTHRHLQCFLLFFSYTCIDFASSLSISKLCGTARGRKDFLLKASVSQASEDRILNQQRATTISDWGSLTAHLSGCVFAAVSLCLYEDYDCRTLKPNVHLRPQAVRGMGEGYRERLDDWRQGNVLVSPSDISMINIPSYNEVMKQHRFVRVPSWERQSITDQDVKGAARHLVVALEAVDTLKSMADNYSWDDMRDFIRTPVLSNDIERASSILRRATFALSDEARATIGFDWGSCAWRHCGAEADTQEALAELYNLLGVLEPFECRFILDIVERSLRDALAVIPKAYFDESLTEYNPYPVRQIEAGEQESSSDEELLDALSLFRNPQWEDE